MPGPAPKPAGERRRRNAPMANTVHLPSEGRTEPAPVWPTGFGHGALADEIWAELWSTPQAVAWERLGYTRVVARYVGCLVAAERDLDDIEDPKLYASMLANQAKLLPEVRQLEDRLGLTPMAMLRLRWEVVEDELAGARDEKKPAPSTRRRLKVAAVHAVAAD